MSLKENLNLRGSIRNLCNYPVLIETKKQLTQFTHEGRLLLDILASGTFTEPDVAPIGEINHLIPLYAPSPNQAVISESEITDSPYLGEFPIDPKHGPAVFYIVPRAFLCFALSRRWDFTSRLLILERNPELDIKQQGGIQIYDPKAQKRPTGRLVSAMNYEVPPEFRYWLQDRDLSLILEPNEERPTKG